MINKANIIKLAVVIVAVSALWLTYSGLRISSHLEELEVACFDELARQLDGGASPELIFQEDFEKLQLLVEQSLVARAEMLQIANRLRLNTDEPLSSRDLVTLEAGTESYLGVRELLYEIANAYACAVDVQDSTLVKFNISPNLRMKGLMLSMSAALTLYDNYLLGIVLFEQDERLRNILNDPDMGFGLVANKLAEATLAANSVEIRHRARRAIEFYEQQKPTIEDAHDDSDFAYLMALIDSSPSYNYTKKIAYRRNSCK